MNQHNRLEIINREGWRREYPLEKGIIHIGNASTNDIVLDNRYGTGVAPFNAQIISAANGNNPVYKLVNLGETNIAVGAEGQENLTPGSVLILVDKQSFILGEFTLVFYSGSQSYQNYNNIAPATTASSRPTSISPAIGTQSIGLKLSMPSTRLAPNQSLEGMATVSNLGQRTGVRFDLELEGLEPDCYDIAPGPMLSSGAEKEVLFRLHHHGEKPLAGDWRIVIRATASKTYPGEQAVASQIIHVLPCYNYRLRLLPAKGITALKSEETTLISKPMPSRKAAPAWQKTQKTNEVWDLPPVNNPSPARQSSLKLKAKSPTKTETTSQGQIVPAKVKSQSPPKTETEDGDWWTETEVETQTQSRPGQTPSLKTGSRPQKQSQAATEEENW